MKHGEQTNNQSQDNNSILKTTSSTEEKIEINQEEIPEEIVLEFNIDEEKKEESKNTQKFESDEHISIGNIAFEQFLEQVNRRDDAADIIELLSLQEETVKVYDHEAGKKISKTLMKIPLTDALALTPGEIVALAGDYFGVPEEPISFGTHRDPQTADDIKEARFIKAYNTLVDPKNQSQIADIMAYIIDQVNADDPETKMTFKKEKDSSLKSNLKFGLMTKETGLPCAFWNSRYIHLALSNFDHFGEEAVQAFRIGHLQAIKTARVAATLEDPKQQAETFRRAMAMELFACHFLTDLYASGHIRTPRKQILNALLGKPLDEIPEVKHISSIKLLAAGLLAKKMHDEDSVNGIYVTSDALQESWQAFGDGSYYKPTNVENAIKAQTAVSDALLDIVHAFKGEPVQLTEKVIPTYVPKADEEQNKTYFPPLFAVNQEKSTVVKRDSHTPLKAIPALSQFFKVKIKTSDNTMEEITEDQAEQLFKTLDKTKATCSII